MGKRFFLGVKLICLGALMAAAGFPLPAQESSSYQGRYFRADPAPGNYRRPQELTLHAEEEGVELAFAFQGVFLPYKRPLELSALENEARSYLVTVEARRNGSLLEKQELAYTIDRSFPSPPEPTVPPGYYDRIVKLGFRVPQGSRVYYAIDDPEKNPYREWDGGTIVIDRFRTVTAYTEDRQGRRSPFRVLTYRIDREQAPFQTLNVFSPAQGEYANPQLLYIEQRGFQWVRYTLNGDDPIENGVDYLGPVLIRKYGSVELKVAAMPRQGGKPLRKNISFRVDTRAPLLSVPSGGLYTERLTIPKQEAYLYCLEERIPRDGDPLLEEPLVLNPINGGIRGFSLHLRRRDSDNHYRFYYILDNRIPGKPVINTEEIGEAYRISIEGPSYAQIYYTADGSTPDLGSPLYREPLEFTPSEASPLGSFVIRARAFGDNGLASPEASQLVTYNRLPPEPPTVTLSQSLPAGGRAAGGRATNGRQAKEAFFYVDAPAGVDIHYEIGYDREASEPGETSPRISRGRHRLSLPEGLAQTVTLRFVARNRRGLLSDPTAPLRVVLDRKPPAPPQIGLDNGILKLAGEGKQYFRFVPESGATAAGNGETGFREYQEESQPLPEGAFRIEAYSQDEFGNRSPMAVAGRSGPEKAPEPPLVSGVDDQGLYRAPRIDLTIHRSRDDLALFYQLLEGRGQGDPPAFQQIPGGSLVIETAAGEDVFYRLRLKARSPSGLESELREYRFRVDRIPPAEPVPTGFEDGASYPEPLTIGWTGPGQDDNTYLAVEVLGAERGDQAAPETEFDFSRAEPFYRYRLSAKAGEEKTYVLRLAARDEAGNVTVNPRTYGVTIDRKAPEAPEISATPEDNPATAPLVLRAAARPGLRIRYTLAEDREEFFFPDGQSPLWQGDQTLSGRSGETVTYTAAFITQDQAGNLLPVPVVRRFRIDREKPAPPSEPEIVINAGEGSALVAWDGLNSGTIEYSLDGGGLYREYRQPFVLRANGHDRWKLQYRAVDAAGNKSEEKSREIGFPRETAAALLKGIPSGSLFNRGVELVKADPAQLIRYEISDSGIPPVPVTPFSHILPESLAFDVLPGEDITFMIRVKAFMDQDDRLGGEEKQISFRIDKRIPSPPTIQGIAEGHYYQENKEFALASEEGRLFYSVAEDSYANGSPDFTLYERPVTLSSEDGTFKTFTVRAFTEDSAGNRSRQVQWSFNIDKEIIYVSPEGNDYYDGTRTKPFRTLTRALKKAGDTDRRTIILAGGNYELNKPILLDEAITVLGGFEAGTWVPGSRRTLIKAGTYYPEGAPLMTLQGDGVQLRGLALNDEGLRGLPLLAVTGGSATLTSMTITGLNNSGRLVEQTGGELFLRNSTIEAEKGGGNPLLVDGGRCLISASTLQSRALHGAEPLVKARGGSQLILQDTDLLAGSGAESTALAMESGSLEMTDCRVRGGAGRIAANVLQLTDCDAKIAYSEIVSHTSSRISSLIYARSSDVTIEKSKLEIDATSGSMVVNQRAGILRMSRNRIDSRRTGEFLYLFRLRDCYALIDTNKVSAEESRDYVAFDLEAVSGKILANTVVARGGSRLNIGFRIGEGETLSVINNIVSLQRPLEGSTALDAPESGSLIVKNNNFGGWRRIWTGSETILTNAESFNLSDEEPFGGIRHGNIEEPVAVSFTNPEAGEWKLHGDSACVEGGVDLAPLGGPAEDWDGQKRPHPAVGIRPRYDIGADEYVPAP